MLYENQTNLNYDNLTSYELNQMQQQQIEYEMKLENLHNPLLPEAINIKRKMTERRTMNKKKVGIFNFFKDGGEVLIFSDN